jgi:hypothetical protein
MTNDSESGIDWDLTTWKGSRLNQHREFLALPFRKKLEMIEDHCEWARKIIGWRKSKGLPYIDPSTGELVRGTASPM